jgi:DtxR family Mn-dependent transcriptional regulator
MLSSTVEDYMKTILSLSQAAGGAGRVLPGQIAGRMGVTPGTVTTMMKHLAEKGLVDYQLRHGVRLTEAGRAVASQVLRRHRLVELFLVRVVKLDWACVHEEAEALEHVISDRLLDRMDDMLGHPTRDPHGDPIPGPGGELLDQQSMPLAECSPGRYRLVRVVGNAPDFLDWLQRHELQPGKEVQVIEHDSHGGTLLVTCGEPPQSLSIGMTTAGKLLVSAEETLVGDGE